MLRRDLTTTLPARTLLLCLLASSVFGADARGQMDPDYPPEPPVERLAALQPFLGLYSHADQTFGDLGPFAGTLEVRPAVKGWYVEWVINTHHRAIDRQNRMIMTWDEELDRYRVWRFETTPQLPRGVVEGSAHFVGDTLVMEWEDFPGPVSPAGPVRDHAHEGIRHEPLARGTSARPLPWRRGFPKGDFGKS